MVSALIVAAGEGIRMGNPVPKQYLMLGDRPVLSHTLINFVSSKLFDTLYLVVRESDFDFCRQTILGPLNLSKDVKLVAGGAERQDSVYNGLRAFKKRQGIVAIHDGVRPFVSFHQLKLCIDGARETDACILAVPVADTLKKVSDNGLVDCTLERERVWHAQTPQAFKYDLIMEALEAARQEGYIASDDALLVERLGHKVKIIEGSRSNFKITTPEDLQIALALLYRRQNN
jgi:2-C-methyl-D-erythritol 4-phosphate cytidylyltransferase